MFPQKLFGVSVRARSNESGEAIPKGLFVWLRLRWMTLMWRSRIASVAATAKVRRGVCVLTNNGTLLRPFDSLQMMKSLGWPSMFMQRLGPRCVSPSPSTTLYLFIMRPWLFACIFLADIAFVHANGRMHHTSLFASLPGCRTCQSSGMRHAPGLPRRKGCLRHQDGDGS